VGLFVVKLWSDYRRPRALRRAPQKPSVWRKLPGWFITFNYVMLSWVFFSAYDLSTAVLTLGRLFGVQP
jgi:D-alanyl-lipoteichoic acid acyltransferase DltB (MBOAT superfamily)